MSLLYCIFCFTGYYSIWITVWQLIMWDGIMFIKYHVCTSKSYNQNTLYWIQWSDQLLFLIASYMTVMPGAPETVLVSRYKNKYQVCSCTSKSFNQNALYRTPCFDWLFFECKYKKHTWKLYDCYARCSRNYPGLTSDFFVLICVTL